MWLMLNMKKIKHIYLFRMMKLCLEIKKSMNYFDTFLWITVLKYIFQYIFIFLFFSTKENDVQKQIQECGNRRHICTTDYKTS